MAADDWLGRAADALALLVARAAGMPQAQLVAIEPRGPTVLGSHGAPSVPDDAWLGALLEGSDADAAAAGGSRQAFVVPIQPGVAGVLAVSDPEGRADSGQAALAVFAPIVAALCRARVNETRLRRLVGKHERQEDILRIETEVLDRIAHHEDTEAILGAILSIREAFGRDVPASVLAVEGGILQLVAVAGLGIDDAARLRAGTPFPSSLRAFESNRTTLARTDGLAGLPTSLSSPIHGPDGRVVGTFDLYYHAGDAPNPVDFRLAETTTQLAAIALEARRVARELDETRRVAAHSEKLAAMGILVAGVAHEVNNPLTVVAGNSDLLAMSMDTLLERDDLPADVRDELEGVREQAHVITRAAERIGTITRNLKRIAKPAKGTRQVLDARELLDTVVSILGPNVPMDVEVRVEGHATKRLVANESEAIQILLNLALNACQAMGPESKGLLTLRSRDDEGRVVLEVQDTGPGIPRDVQKRLFTPFFTTRPDGTGLGLSISHRLAADNGGALTFESEPGHGATFRLALPSE